MNNIQFQRLDLNLLRVLEALLEHKSVAHAGQRLGVTPSAISHALGRLRLALGDPLFVRRANRLEPTQRAVEIGLRLNAALSRVRMALDDAVFDPASTDREYGMIGHSYVVSTLVPQIAQRFRSEAPRARLRFLAAADVDMVSELESGRSDVALGVAPVRRARLDRSELFSDDLVWVARRDHPIAVRALTLEAIAEATHVVIESLRPAYGEEPEGAAAQQWRAPNGLQALLAQRGMTHAIGATVPDTAAALAMIVRSDMIALMPRRVAVAVNAGGGLQLMEPPHPTYEIRCGMCFARERAGDPAIAWFLDLIRAAAPAIAVAG